MNAIAEMRCYKYTSGSGREIERYFCGTCGSPILTLHPAQPESAWVKAGIINQPDVVKPAFENWIQDKVEWATINVAESHEEGSQR